MNGKRQDYLSWDEYFMGIAMLSGMRSKDPNTQVGAASSARTIRFFPWDIMELPNGCSDDEYPWAREGDDPLETKYVYAVHSELNAILNYGGET